MQLIAPIHWFYYRIWVFFRRSTTRRYKWIFWQVNDSLSSRWSRHWRCWLYQSRRRRTKIIWCKFLHSLLSTCIFKKITNNCYFEMHITKCYSSNVHYYKLWIWLVFKLIPVPSVSAWDAHVTWNWLKTCSVLHGHFWPNF